MKNDVHTFKWFNSFLTLVMMLLLISPLSAKTVVCVDGHDDPNKDNDREYISNHEGYARANIATGANDIVTVGGDLKDCLAQLADGDRLVIIAHGGNNGEGFFWGGTYYTGFGNGANEIEVPADFDELDDVTVDFCSCWSNRDPDGNGTNTSMVDKLLDEMGNNNTGNGFTNLAEIAVCIGWTAPNSTTQAEINMALMELDNKRDEWAELPPGNRPGANPNQQTKAQEIVDNKVGAGKVTITLTYNKAPQDVVNSDNGGGCGCLTEPGCGFGGIVFDPDIAFPIPTMSQWGFFLFILIIFTTGIVLLYNVKKKAIQ